MISADAMALIKVFQEGYDVPLWIVEPTNSGRWIEVHKELSTDHMTKVDTHFYALK